jgi:hypothetical protein
LLNTSSEEDKKKNIIEKYIKVTKRKPRNRIESLYFYELKEEMSKRLEEIKSDTKDFIKMDLSDEQKTEIIWGKEPEKEEQLIFKPHFEMDMENDMNMMISKAQTDKVSRDHIRFKARKIREEKLKCFEIKQEKWIPFGLPYNIKMKEAGEGDDGYYYKMDLKL